LGHFLLTGLLSPQLSDDARIVTVSSTAHTIAGSKGMDWDYCWTAGSAESSSSTSVYGPWRSYGQSKLANILFTQELHRKSRAAGRNWTAVTLHPGVVATDLARYMMPSSSATTATSQGNGGVGGWLTNLFLKGLASFLKTPAQGATTQVWLASRADQATSGGNLNDIGGKYFVDCQEQELPWYATDAYAARRLWTESQERVGGVEYAFLDTAFIKETVRQD
jgi:NAD(P)-dependent dehydrogenase (short-subunit alcohol dehydrogenase family)